MDTNRNDFHPDQRESLGGDFYALLIRREDNGYGEDAECAVLISYEPGAGDKPRMFERWRLSQPKPHPDLGEPLIAEFSWRGATEIAEWKSILDARVELNLLVRRAQAEEGFPKDLLGLPGA